MKNKNYNKIKLTKNKMDLNKRKMIHPPQASATNEGTNVQQLTSKPM